MSRVNESFSSEWLTLLCVLLGCGYVGHRVLNVKERLEPFADVPFASIDFRTGDVLLFQSNLALSFFLNSPYSHVGMIVRFEGETFLWEITGRGRRATLTAVSADLNATGAVYYRRLLSPVDEDTALEHVRANAGFTYDFSTWQHVLHNRFQNALFPRLPTPTTPSGASCANMLGRFYQDLGMFPGKEYFLPEDFSALSGETRWSKDQRIIF